MAAKWTGFYKIIQQQPTTSAEVTDNQQIGSPGSYGNYNWYHKIIQGSASRLVRYREWDLMDNDIDISRALDLIAEEMIGNNTKDDDPLILEVDDIDNVDVTNNMVATLKAALTHWSNIHDWDNRLFNIARYTVKYGDVFFRKDTGKPRWVFIHPKDVISAVVNAEDVTDVQGWQIKNHLLDAKTSYGVPSSGVGGTEETEFYQASEIVRCTLNDDMSDNAPFGESVLRPVYRTFKQKELLEDAVVIYRIQRAPERRVFYIDVGKMPPQRIKQYLEQIKNEIKQKKIPTFNGNNSEIEAVYNPQCIALNTKIPLLDGKTLTLSEIIEEFENGKELWAYSCNPKTGEIVPGKIDWAGITRKNTEIIQLTLDNGKVLECTPDHLIPVQGKGFVEAQHLTENDSLIPFNTRRAKVTNNKPSTYEQVYDISDKSWKFTHRIVANFMKNVGEMDSMVHDTIYESSDKNIIHHKNFNRYDNSPTNLTFMNDQDHFKYHSESGIQDKKALRAGWERWRANEDLQAEYSSRMSKEVKQRLEDNPSMKAMYSDFISRNRYKVGNQEVVFNENLLSIIVSKIADDVSIKLVDLLEFVNNDEGFVNEFVSINCDKELGVDSGEKTVNLCKIGDKLTPKMFRKQLKLIGFNDFKALREHILVEKLKSIVNLSQKVEPVTLDIVEMLLKRVSVFGLSSTNVCESLTEDKKALKEFNIELRKLMSNPRRNETTKVSVRELNFVGKKAGFGNYKNLVNGLSNSNHVVKEIVRIADGDTGCITIDNNEKYHNYHTFATDSGVFIKNSQNEDFFLAQRSDGKGSRIETLPGGQNLGSIEDLDYFGDKVFRGLRIPLSYMKEGDSGGAVFNDGKLGQSYIVELRFSLYVQRLQASLERVMDEEFKSYLKSIGINIDNGMFKIKLPEPSNFGKYREQEMDAALLGMFGSADSLPYLSKKFSMKRYLKLTDEEILENERAKLIEIGENPDNYDPAVLAKIYSPESMDMGGDVGGLGGGDFGGGELSAGDMMTPEGGEGGADLGGADTGAGGL